MEMRLDWLTLTLKPENGRAEESAKQFTRTVAMLASRFCLNDLFSKMVYRGRCRFYEGFQTYNNITIKLPKPEKFYDQGLCIELSSLGLDYFTEYLSEYGLTLRQWLFEWRALCFKGYESKVTRLDWAFDDICFDNAPTTISMLRVVRSISNGEICCKARVSDDEGSDIKRLFFYKMRRKRVKGEDLEGLTIQLGKRDSHGKICRFYDKLTEQKQKGSALPENCTAWTRCEFEFKGGDSMSALNAYIDLSPEEFSKHITGVAFGFVRFIKRDNNNISRCTTKRWWTAFLNGCSKAVKTTPIKPVRSCLAKSIKGIKQYLAVFYTMIQVYGEKGFISFLNSLFLESDKDLLKLELVHNIQENDLAYEKVSAFNQYNYNSDLSEDELKERIKLQSLEYYYHQSFANPSVTDNGRDGVLNLLGYCAPDKQVSLYDL